MANVTTVAVVCTNRPQYAYVVNNGGNTVSQFAIDASGILSPLSVPTVATGNAPQSITVDPSSKYAYVTNLANNTISQYVIQGDGTLAPNTPATIATGHAPWALAISPSGSWAYVANSADNTISQFSISASGALVATSIAPVATGVEPWNVTLSSLRRESRRRHAARHRLGIRDRHRRRPDAHRHCRHRSECVHDRDGVLRGGGINSFWAQ
jgi:6-phosphogluconolactonase (cycloisomerase 2 family)